jgi:hypothetical protein
VSVVLVNISLLFCASAVLLLCFSYMLFGETLGTRRGGVRMEGMGAGWIFPLV